MDRNKPPGMGDNPGFSTQMQYVADGWRSLNPNVPPGELQQGLTRGVAMLLRLQGIFANWSPLPETPPRNALEKGHLDVLTEAVDLIKKMNESLHSSSTFSGWKSLVHEAFGPQSDHALHVFRETTKSLERLLKDSEVGKENAEKGFVLSSGLPKSMAALAVGAGANAYIRIRPFAPTGVNRSELVNKLVPSLVHEGTHTIKPGATADLVYRKNGLHAALPYLLRPANAANFEQLAIDWIAPSREQWAGIAAKPPTLSRADKALAIMRIKVSRAWVCAYNIRQATYGDEGAVTFKYPEWQSSVSSLIGAEADVVGALMAQGRLDELNDAADALMKVVGDEEFVLTDPPHAKIKMSGRELGVVPDPVATAGQLASAALQVVVADLTSRGLVAFPEELLTWVSVVMQSDKLLNEALLGAVNDFLAELAAS
ncbi:hypothetical protein [Pseudofrankia inefficax]|nr:hypothetical protein [Pseudofrankia inefficax]